MKRRINRTPLIIVVVLLVVCLFALAVVVGHKQGEQSGERTKVRLELVWPSFMNLPSTDRALLAGFSMTCELDRLDKRATDAVVIDCLRAAAANPDAVRPKGMGQQEAAERLETLITQAQGK